MPVTKSGKLLLLCCLILLLTQAACVEQAVLPTLVAPILLVQGEKEPLALAVPPTFTPPPPNATIDPRLNFGDNSPMRPTLTPSSTPIFPSRTPTPTPTPTPPNTPTQAPLPPPAPIGGIPPYLQGDPNRSKLSIHVISNNDARIMDFVRQARPAVIKGVDDFGYLAEVERVSPNTIIVARRDEINQDYGGNPEEAARRFVQSQLRQYQLNPAVDFWEGWNEPAPGLDRMAWYARFEQERVRELARYGFRAAIGGFAAGVPEVNEFALFIPAIETAMQYGGILTLHEYSAPVMTQGYGSALPGYPYHDDRGSLTFRYRWFYEELLIPRGLVIPLVISEAGIDGILGNRPGPPGKGWADFQEYAVNQGWGGTGVDAFINQLAWYDGGVRQDNYVLGFTVFTAGPVAQWGPYDIGPILPRMADYVRSQE
jgi:hypothetical protein